MITRMGIFTRKDGLTQDQFVRHWRDVHGPLADRLIPGMVAYHQNAITDATQKGITFPRGPLNANGISQLFFDDLSAMRDSVTPEAIAEIAADEPNFIGEITVITALRQVVVPPPQSGKFVKRMSLLQRRTDIPAHLFRSEWTRTHAELVLRMPGVRGYVQHLVIDHARGGSYGKTGQAHAAVDGVVEFWFDDEAAILQAFATDAAQTLMTHAKEFLATISTFMVDPYIVRDGVPD